MRHGQDAVHSVISQVRKGLLPSPALVAAGAHHASGNPARPGTHLIRQDAVEPLAVQAHHPAQPFELVLAQLAAWDRGMGGGMVRKF